MSVTRQRECGTMEHHPKTPEERIAAFRQIIDEGAYAKIDGTMIDLFTANCVVQVYDALNDKNKANFSKMIAPRMGHVAFQLANKKDNHG